MDAAVGHAGAAGTNGQLTLRDARAAFFEEQGLGDGGYDLKWVPLKMGPLEFAIPNTPSRVRAVRLHDLHHLLTGYKTDWIGEFEISAWEVASNCRDYAAAWVLNLSGMAGGMLVAPRRVWRAFVRGRATENLYREGYSEALVEETVEQVLHRTRLDQPTPAGTVADAVAFSAAIAAGWFIGTAVFLAPPILAVAGLIAGAYALFGS